MKYEITMKDHHVALQGEIDSYLYECGGYTIEVMVAMGYDEMNVKSCPSSYVPQVSYVNGKGMLSWHESIYLNGEKYNDPRDNFLEEAAKAQEIFHFFAEHFDELKQGVIPTWED